jgi:hypothetical protein
MNGKTYMIARLAVMAGVAVAMGCVSPHTTISSVRAPGVTETLTDVFVISQVGMDGEVSTQHFEQVLQRTGNACGVRLAITSISRLDLAPQVHLERLKQSSARHVLTLRQSGGITGAHHWSYYDAALSEREPERMIWRADVHLSTDGALFGDPAERLAIDLLRALRNDHFIAPCKDLVDPYAAPPAALQSDTHRGHDARGAAHQRATVALDASIRTRFLRVAEPLLEQPSPRCTPACCGPRAC